MAPRCFAARDNLDGIYHHEEENSLFPWPLYRKNRLSSFWVSNFSPQIRAQHTILFESSTGCFCFHRCSRLFSGRNRFGWVHTVVHTNEDTSSVHATNEKCTSRKKRAIRRGPSNKRRLAVETLAGGSFLKNRKGDVKVNANKVKVAAPLQWHLISRWHMKF